jgi:hypothetical protein
VAGGGTPHLPPVLVGWWYPSEKKREEPPQTFIPVAENPEKDFHAHEWGVPHGRSGFESLKTVIETPTERIAGVFYLLKMSLTGHIR